MKPLKISVPTITKSVLVNSVFTRFVGTADKIFDLFIKSLNDTGEFDRDCHYIIIDSDHLHLKLFKEIINWNTQDNLKDYIEQQARILGVDVAVENLEQLDSVKSQWEKFRASRFAFFNIDITLNIRRFLHLLDRLPLLPKKTSQYVNIAAIDTDQHSNAVNDILHNLWIKNIKQYSSVVKIKHNNHEFEDYAGKLYTRLNPYFCILPWMHIQYKPNGQSKLCCRYDNVKESNDYNQAEQTGISAANISQLLKEKENLTIQKSTIEDSFNSNYWNTARQYTLDNNEISGCHKCYKEEQVQGEVATSMRLGSSILYNEGYLHRRPKFEQPKLEFLEVGFGNYCNLACLSCNSTLSTTWHDDEVKLNQQVDKRLQRSVFPKLDNLKFVPNDQTLKDLTLIKFTGGEPMINPEFTKFIDLVCEKGYPEKISLEIYTNCSYIPSAKLLSNLTKFKNVQLNLSIDAYGSVNDYIRYGSHWEGSQKQTVSNAIDFWLDIGKNHESFSIIMSTTLSALNILEIPKLMDWWMDKFKDSGNKITVRRKTLLATEYDGFFKLQPAHDPYYINLNLLPKLYYLDVLEWINEYRDNYINRYPELGGIPECIGASLLKLEQLISKAKGNADNAQDFLTYLSKMDSIRNNSAEQSIPEIVSRVQEYLQVQGKQT